MKNFSHKEKILDELKSMTTKRLLSYYKSEREKFFKYESYMNRTYNMSNDMINESIVIYNKWGDYLDVIKTELSKRENI